MTIAIPKGRLYKSLCKLFQTVGVILPEEGRQYFYKDFFGNNINLYIAKPKAIPQLLESRLCQYGFCGKDIMIESMATVNELYDTNLNKVSIVLAAKHNAEFPINRPVICATEFPNIANSYFIEKGLPHYVLNTSGATEGYTDVGADCIIDLCETGITLERNGLEIKEVLTTSSTRLFSNVNAPHIDIINQIIKQ